MIILQFFFHKVNRNSDFSGIISHFANFFRSRFSTLHKYRFHFLAFLYEHILHFYIFLYIFLFRMYTVTGTTIREAIPWQRKQH